MIETNNQTELVRDGNYAFLYGKILSKPKMFKRLQTNVIYSTAISVERNSGVRDTIQVCFDEFFQKSYKLNEGDVVGLIGLIKTYSYINDEYSADKKMLSVYMYAIDVYNGEHLTNNLVILEGRVCKAARVKETMHNKLVASTLLALHRYNKSYYVPIVGWRNNAALIENMQMGQKIAVIARFQSREYLKEGRSVITHELAVMSISLKPESFDLGLTFEKEIGRKDDERETSINGQ